MAPLIDTASVPMPLTGEDLRRWAAGRAAFISSVQDELAAERLALAEALEGIGMRAIRFEALGGREESAETAYLAGVAEAEIYVGIIGDRYGTMLADGRSATHQEYRRARELGRRIAVWARTDGSARQGDARDLLAEVRLFHTTGSFESPEELARSVLARVAEIAADDQAPWVKLGEAILRAQRIRDEGGRVEISAMARDPALVRYVEGLRPDNWGRRGELPLTTPERSGSANIVSVTSETESRGSTELAIVAEVAWGEGRGGATDVATGGYSADDLTEIGLRAGLLGESPPETLSGMMASSLLDTDDPLVELPSQDLSEGVLAAAARLLLVERLVGRGKASHIDEFAIGPVRNGSRPIRLEYTDPQRYVDRNPGRREIEGERRWA